MTKVNIIVPVADYDRAEEYYSSVMGFECLDGVYFLPNGVRDAAIKLMMIDREASIHFPPKKGFPIFGYRIEAGFLRYCEELRSRGALIEEVLETPGGYYARLADPDGNQFEVECEAFDEDDTTFDKSAWSFYRRL